jgi:hypothetical protein
MGRKKKRGERYPSGKLKPTGPALDPVVWQRLRADGARLFSDPKISSAIGRLVFARELTALQAVAAERIGEIYGRFERNHQIKRHVRSASYETGSGASGKTAADEQLIAADTAFKAVQAELLLYPRQVRDHLETLCIEGIGPPSGWLPIIRGALDDFTRFFGISTARERKAARKQQRQAKPSPAPTSAPTASTTPTPKPEPIEKIAYLDMLKAMRPDLDAASRAMAWDLFLAMKDRARFNHEKSRSVKEMA